MRIQTNINWKFHHKNLIDEDIDNKKINAYEKRVVSIDIKLFVNKYWILISNNGYLPIINMSIK